MWEIIRTIGTVLVGLFRGRRTHNRLDFESLNERSMALIDKLNENLNRAEERIINMETRNDDREKVLDAKWQARAKEWDERESDLEKQVADAAIRSRRYETEGKRNRLKIEELEDQARGDKTRIVELEAEVNELKADALRLRAVAEKLRDTAEKLKETAERLKSEAAQRDELLRSLGERLKRLEKDIDPKTTMEGPIA